MQDRDIQAMRHEDNQYGEKSKQVKSTHKLKNPVNYTRFKIEDLLELDDE